MGLAAGTIGAALTTLCAIAMVLVPDGTVAVASVLFHTDLRGLARTPTWGTYFGSLAGWGLGAGLIAAWGAWLYGRWARVVPAAP